jgi:hypothetical protein
LDRRNAMKSKGTIFGAICLLAAAGLAIGVGVERHAGAKLKQQNRALRQQLSQVDQFFAENRRLSNLMAQASASPSSPNERSAAPSATDDRPKELVRLRSEVAALRQQAREIESLREDTRQVRAAQGNGLSAQNAGRAAKTRSATMVNGSEFEILSAEYWTANTNMDVVDELSERIRPDGLKAVASNNIKGDPEFGQVKHLTVVYRFGGATRTNEFREGDLVILPGE